MPARRRERVRRAYLAVSSTSRLRLCAFRLETRTEGGTAAESMIVANLAQIHLPTVLTRGELMNDAKWLQCNSPMPMLDFLQGRISDRKLRLFAVACCRPYWHLLDARKRRAIEILERYADGGSTDKEVRELARLFDKSDSEPAQLAVANAVMSLLNPLLPADATRDAMFAAHHAARAAGKEAGLGWESSHEEGGAEHRESLPGAVARAQESQAQCRLLRDIVGDPFRPVAVDHAWNVPAVAARARTIYESRTFDRMLELALSLANAGCADNGILEHCRTPGPHVRGCWVLDVILGKASLRLAEEKRSKGPETMTNLPLSKDETAH